ncbi:hypothetical protein K438DRAFT_2004841 [Mycena galopus ATCC 62051]|nr:hypothetical protein K438DRAFT_2004841 [Mycena galopus ATCC 62051]
MDDSAQRQNFQAQTLTLNVLRHKHIIVGAPSSIWAYSPPPSGIRFVNGKRRKREVALTAADLYLDDARPGLGSSSISDRHRCPICDASKSHPVVNKCGHGYCYVCICLRLETEWTCPVHSCQIIIREPPAFDYEVAQSLAMECPGRVTSDRSRVFFSWSGLSFPYRPKTSRVGSSPSP